MTNFIIENWWKLFLACFVVLMITSLWMNFIAKRFIIGEQHFSIFDLELPVSEMALYGLLSQLPDRSKSALRKHLWIDFIFMPALYISIGLLCYKTSLKMEHAGKWVFAVMAFLQAIPWLFDIMENIFLLGKLNGRKNVVSEKNSAGFNFFQFLVKTKFAIALTGAVCSIFGLLYFWIIGSFEKRSLLYLFILLGLIVIFSVVNKRVSKKMAVKAAG
jgi:hypothetical protein